MSAKQTKQLHVVHIIPTLRYGGAERLVVDLVNGLHDRGTAVSIITFCNDTPLARELHPGVRHVVVEKRGKFALSLSRRLALALRMMETDVVHTHLFGGDLWGRMAGKRLCIPVVTTEHSTNDHEGRWKHVFRRLFSPGSDRYIAVSQEVKKYLQVSCGVKKDIAVIHPGIDLARFENTPAPCDAPLRLLMLGRLVPEKGFAIGLGAVQAIGRDEWTLTIVGSGGEEGRLRSLVRDLGLKSNVTFLPAQDNVARLYSRADVVLVPSLFEGFGMVATEALASGRVVIASRVGAIPDMIEDGVNGFLVSPGVAEEIEQKIEWILAHRDDARTMAVAAGKSVQAYSLSRMIDDYEALYQAL